MNSNLKNATEKYKESVLGKTRKIEVPELPADDGSPMVIFVRPATLKVRNELMQYAEDGKMLELLVATIVVRSVDEDGKKLFTNADKKCFMEDLDADFVTKLATEINEDLNQEDPKQDFIDTEKK